MKNSIKKVIQSVVLVLALTSCEKESASDSDEVILIQASGNISDKVEQFRNMLGQLNSEPGATSGRREINWDGVPDSLEGKALPDDLFNPVGSGATVSMQRGLTYDPNGGTFMVSSNNFSDINNDASSNFSAFSGNKTFSNVGAAKWPVSFQKAGTDASASVQGFGAVFSDVDEGNTTSLELFNGTKSIGKFFVPAHDNTSSFSFLGVYFKNSEHITKVLVTHDGFLAEGTKDVSDGGTRDLIVLDDFIYSEPLEEK